MSKGVALSVVITAITCACGSVGASDTAVPKIMTAESKSARVEIWVVLTEAPVAGAPKGQLELVKRQQDAVMARLHELGATEVARVTISSNALAVSIDSAKIADVKRVSGVRSVSAVQHIEREPPSPPLPTR